MLIKHNAEMHSAFFMPTRGLNEGITDSWREINMSETVNQGTNEATEQKTEEKLFTQDEVNGFFNKRYSDLMSQLEEYKKKAEKFDEIEESNKSELQKATERAQQLETELNSLKKADELRVIREKVAQETGVPAKLLTADSEEGCTVQAQQILSFAKPQSYPTVKDGGEVNHVGKQTTKQQFAEWADAAFY